MLRLSAVSDDDFESELDKSEVRLGQTWSC